MKVFILVFITVSALLYNCCSLKISKSYIRLRSSLLMAREVNVTNLDNKQTIQIEAGLPLSLAAVRSGMRLSFQCKAGHCSSCETILDGARVRTCVTRVPNKEKISISKAPPKR